MKKQCYGVKKRIDGCGRDVKSLVGRGLSAKGWCGASVCLDAIAKCAQQDLAKKKAKIDREKTREAKERIETLERLCSRRQSDVNAMIRAVDQLIYGKCIATDQAISDAGHFYHAGSAFAARMSCLFP